MSKQQNIINQSNSSLSSKGKLISTIIIIALLVSFCLFFIIYLINDARNRRSAELFESAYILITKDFNSANIYSKEEMAKEIIPILDEIIAKYPNTNSGKRSLFYKGYVLYYLEKFNEASPIFEKIVKKQNYYLTDKSYYFLSYCYENQDNIDKAINVLTMLDNKKKSSYYDPLFFYRIASLYEKKNDKNNAIIYYKKIVDLPDDSSQKSNAKKRIAILENEIVF
jgi:tetratricopeptide (TPR) repeat protein